MTQLHINLSVLADRRQELERRFREIFVPAIRVQPGFDRVSLLQQVESDTRYVIELSFETEAQRRAWVESKEHQTAFPQIAELCEERSPVRYELIAAASAGGSSAV
jgi:heme-degrading monooxygenase HmoA